jgi:hypothetical protein
VAGAGTAEVGQEQLVGLTDDDVDDPATAVEGDADLASGLVGELAEAGGQGRGDDAVGGDLPRVEPLEALLLAGLQAGDVAVDFQVSSSSRAAGPLRVEYTPATLQPESGPFRA